VLVSGSRTERLLILKKGAVAIIKDNVEIAKVAEAGTVFGELSVLLDQPHTADACALEPSEFYIADATALQGGPQWYFSAGDIFAASAGVDVNAVPLPSTWR
jgi:CRP/FNR family cyclic AMP-dependent transcriptional regulator